MTTHIVDDFIVHGGPTVKVMLVGPETAERWLLRNKRNRSVRPNQVRTYAADMAAGLWQVTGEAIKFDTDGNLIDGQHRLHAIVLSGMTIQTVVMTGLAAAAQQVMDSGVKRTAADALGFSDYKHQNILAASARLLIALESGLLRSPMTAVPTVSHSSIVKFVELNPGIHDAIQVTNGWRVVGISHAAGAAAAFAIRAIDQDQADRFIRDVMESRTNGKGDPRQALIHRLQSAKLNREQLSRVAEMWCVFRAWNAHRDGEQMFRIQVNGLSTWADPR